ncbi:MAG TPA: flagellar transcriptional regulator FlhD [Paraburkholderia sp.]|nr:flagellar transcriptional regulator FlhD [Paraburkholderia sp.]
MSATTPSDMLSEINEINLSYLLLAQRLLRDDRSAGMFRMGISDQLADVLTRLSAAQAARLAASSQLLCRFRFDEHAILSALAEKGKAAQIHAAMLIASQSVEQV